MEIIWRGQKVLKHPPLTHGLVYIKKGLSRPIGISSAAREATLADLQAPGPACAPVPEPTSRAKIPLGVAMAKPADRQSTFALQVSH